MNGLILNGLFEFELDGFHDLIVIWDGFVAEVVKGDGDSCAWAQWMEYMV